MLLYEMKRPGIKAVSIRRSICLVNARAYLVIASVAPRRLGLSRRFVVHVDRRGFEAGVVAVVEVGVTGQSAVLLQRHPALARWQDRTHCCLPT